MKVYIAGGIGTNWQDKVMEAAPDDEYLDPRSHGLTDEKMYTQWDLAAIREADIVFAYLEADNPAGHNMAFELGFAHALGKPILFVNESQKFDRYMGMLKAVSHTYFDSFDDALQYFSKKNSRI